MLILTRSLHASSADTVNSRENEIVIIASNGERTVVRVLPGRGRAGHVRIGVEAPRSVKILRGELEAVRGETATPRDVRAAS